MQAIVRRSAWFTNLTLGAGLVLALFGDASHALAYRTGADLFGLDSDVCVTFRTAPIPLELSSIEGPTSTVLTENLLRVSLDRWNASECGDSLLAYTGRVRSAVAPSDGANTVQWVTSGWSAYGEDAAAAVADVQYEEVDGVLTIVEADVYLNGDTIEWDGLTLTPSGQALPSALSHELGHVLGLAHPCEVDGTGGAPVCADERPTALMTPFFSPLTYEPGRDDVEGLCFLYAADSTDGSTLAPRDSAAGCEDASAGCGAGMAADGGIRSEGDVAEPTCTSEDCPKASSLGEVGDRCNENAQCLSGYCIEGPDGTLCSRSCGEDAAAPECPLGFECAPVSDLSLCRPRDVPRGEACSVRAPGSNSAPSLSLAMSCALAFLRSRKRARRRS